MANRQRIKNGVEDARAYPRGFPRRPRSDLGPEERRLAPLGIDLMAPAMAASPAPQAQQIHADPAPTTEKGPPWTSQSGLRPTRKNSAGAQGRKGDSERAAQPPKGPRGVAERLGVFGSIPRRRRNRKHAARAPPKQTPMASIRSRKSPAIGPLFHRRSRPRPRGAKGHCSTGRPRRHRPGGSDRRPRT